MGLIDVFTKNSNLKIIIIGSISFVIYNILVFSTMIYTNKKIKKESKSKN